MWRGSVPPWRMPSAAWRLDDPQRAAPPPPPPPGGASSSRRPALPGDPPRSRSAGCPALRPAALSRGNVQLGLKLCICIFRRSLGGVTSAGGGGAPGRARRSPISGWIRLDLPGEAARAGARILRRGGGRRRRVSLAAELRRNVPTSPGRSHTGPSARASAREWGEGGGRVVGGPSGRSTGPPVDCAGPSPQVRHEEIGPISRN